MSYIRAKVAALRVKLVLASAVTVAAPAFLLGLLWSSELGRKLAREVGWEVQALLVAIAVVGLGMLVYAFVFIRVPPETDPAAESGDTESTADV